MNLLEAIFRAMATVADANTDQLARLVGEVRWWLDAPHEVGVLKTVIPPFVERILQRH